MKLNLKLRLREVYGGDGFVRFEKREQIKLDRSKKRVIVRQDVGVPVTDEEREKKTEEFEQDIQTFKKDENGNYYLRLGGVHGKLWGALKEAAYLLKDSESAFRSYAYIDRLMKGVQILPIWVKFEKVVDIKQETLPQILSGGFGSMIFIHYDVIPECKTNVQLIFPDKIEEDIKKILNTVQNIGCLNKRRASIKILQEQEGEE